MRELDWPAISASPGLQIDMPGLRVHRRAASGATLVSGDVQAAIDTLSPGAEQVGLGGEIGGSAFALRVARDRALLVTDAPLAFTGQWYATGHTQGFALTPADDAWVFFELEGTLAAQAIAEGTAADLQAGSPCAAIIFTGQIGLLARYERGFLLGVEAPLAGAFLAWIDALAMIWAGEQGSLEAP